MARPKKLPKLTHLQFLILDVIGEGTLKGFEIMDALKEVGEFRQPAAFYQLMNRLEEGGMLKSVIHSTVVKRQNYREKYYTATTAGKRYHDEAMEFYSARAKLVV